jgi:hypothetical protein
MWQSGPTEEVIKHVARSAAIELLEERIAELERRNQDLLEHNNELLARARLAEGKLRAVRARVNGEWDQPDLIAYGPLSTTADDLLRISEPSQN